MRQDTDAWSLLVWAYKTECVRACAGGTADWVQTPDRSSLCMAERRGGLINGWLPVHEDSLWVDAWVRQLKRDDYWLMVKHAERGEVPSRDVKLPPLKCRPVMRQTAHGPVPKMLRHPRTHRPYACLVEFVGYSPAEIARAQAEADARAARFEAMLVALFLDLDHIGQPLGKWRVLEPWKGYYGRTKSAA
ncbi:hypothetical protein [Rhodoligotrophos ferricapiens]|uniref:hypothetical protein n=1 Tax=Rhodoligotrophos ferricapiens TaxID=3069264 RepID=UPI00315CC72A